MKRQIKNKIDSPMSHTAVGVKCQMNNQDKDGQMTDTTAGI